MEVDALKRSPLVGKTIRELKLPDDTMICAIVRDHHIIFPDQDTEIIANDRVITYARHKAVKKLEKKLHSS